MTLKQLLDSFTFDEIAPCILNRYKNCDTSFYVYLPYQREETFDDMFDGIVLRNLIDTYENERPMKSLSMVAECMRKEFALWHDRIII